MKGRNIVDKIVLKTATLKDKEFLKLIYNDELVNAKSLNTEIRVVNDKEIIKTLKYFSNKGLYYYIVYYGEMKIGVAMIYEINIQNNFAMIGIALIKQYRGKSIGEIIVNL